MKEDLFNLEGKTILVTGGAGLIGSTFVETLYFYGADVVIGDINQDKAESLIKDLYDRNKTNRIVFKYLDITNPESVMKCISNIVSEFGKIDVLVNNAYPRNKNYGSKYENIDFNDWKENVDMHLNGYFLVSHVASKQMMKQRFGKIINIASIYGMRGPRFKIYEGTNMTMPAEYAAIKGGIINFTRYLATYLGPYQITANCISFGGVYDNQPESFVKKYSEMVPLGRMANKEDLRGVIVFLASDSSNYITGQNIVVDGGWTAS
ncbi:MULTISPECIES: oxidoreductase [Aeribacillus]|uniref:oxidoreductase n=1 Tax=Aeribacillus TaxID=1055323 RepID=UPI002E227FB4|nr:oxidoreductase [Aeribacillus composti]